METCTIREIKSFDEIEFLFSMANNSKHANAVNYEISEMRDRWEKYLLFTVLERGKEIISFAGIYPFNEKLVRVADRFFTFDIARQKEMTRHVIKSLRPAVDYIIPYHTEWAKKRGYDCFYSIQELKKRDSLIRIVNLLDKSLGYSILPNLYATCDPRHPLCWQNIAATTKDVDLPKKPILRGRKELPFLAKMPEPYIFDIAQINKEVEENSSIMEGLKDYIAKKVDKIPDAEYTGRPIKVYQQTTDGLKTSIAGTAGPAGDLGDHQESYTSYEDGTYIWYPISVYDQKNTTQFQDYKSLEKEPEFDERRYTKILQWAKGTYIEEVINTFKSQVTRVHMRRMLPEGYLNYHMDYDTKYSIRFHIPLKTNPDSYFKFKKSKNTDQEEIIHIPADGSCYFFNQGIYHSAFNKGKTERDHLILSVHGQDDIVDL